MSIDEAYGLYDATGLAGLVVSNEVQVAERVEGSLLEGLSLMSIDAARAARGAREAEE